MFKSFMPKMVFGSGSLNDLDLYAREMGGNAALVIDPYLHASGLTDRIASLLAKKSIGCTVFHDVEPNPSCHGIDAAALTARHEGCDFIIAIGGGSAIDFGKALAVTVPGNRSSWDYTERSDHDILRPGRNTLPVITIPTTSGTGSEATPFSVLNNPDIKEKSTIVSDLIYPALSLIDPTLMLTMPKRITASTGFDAFAHALESFISLQANPFTRMVGLEAISSVVKYLPQAVNDGNNLEAREKMAWASTLAGASIAGIGVTLPHSLAQPVGGMFNAPHGETIAACMVSILRHSWDADVENFARLAAVLRPENSNLPAIQRAQQLPDIVQEFMDEIELSIRFSDFGMQEKDIKKATDIAQTGYYFDISNHPKKFSTEEIHGIYKECI